MLALGYLICQTPKPIYKCVDKNKSFRQEVTKQDYSLKVLCPHITIVSNSFVSTQSHYLNILITSWEVSEMISETTCYLYPKMLGWESPIEQLLYEKHFYCNRNSSYCILNNKFQAERYILQLYFINSYTYF